MTRGFRVRGRVQGVGFRWWTRLQAEQLGLDGTVRNHADGSVEVHARGSAEALGQLHQRLQRGPAGAAVDRVELVEPAPSLGAGFHIVR